MLSLLQVKEFAIIDELTVEFEEGLNVITGETGAGKSIIINALATFVNQKTPADVVRHDARQSTITGHFYKGDRELILKRIVSATGRSRAAMNEEPITLSKLEETGNYLINFYGQNDFRDLLAKDMYVRILDRLLVLDAEREYLAEKVRELRKIETELESKKTEMAGRDRETELLEFQIDEIERENIKEDEEESLRDKLKILTDYDKIKRIVDAISHDMYEDDNSFYATLKGYISSLKSLGEIRIVAPLKEQIEAASFNIEEILISIRAVEKDLYFDPEELAKCESRLSRLYELKNKYGRTFTDIMNYADAAQRRLDYLKGISRDLGVLEEKRKYLENDIKERAENLSNIRRKAKTDIEQMIMEELAFLSMEKSRFEISVSDKEQIDEEGKDDIEFLISTNVGEPLRPLRRVASGGELSRIMLAMKKVMGDDEDKTLIFDEVDTGIGGKVADIVGMRLKELSKRHQIICITHLPQIAVYGNSHFLVEKDETDGKTKTTIRKLTEEERAKEIARMLGGVVITEKTLERSEEMIRNAQKSSY